ncbi:MAG: hypothetical protein R8G66_18365 [Cytophagales bacterium]|nr:hypothetical protein [Cytophagales bacterium]
MENGCYWSLFHAYLKGEVTGLSETADVQQYLYETMNTGTNGRINFWIFTVVMIFQVILEEQSNCSVRPLITSGQAVWEYVSMNQQEVEQQ